MHLSCSYLDWVLVFVTVVINTHLMDLESFRIYILSKCHLKMSRKKKKNQQKLYKHGEPYQTRLFSAVDANFKCFSLTVAQPDTSQFNSKLSAS